MSIQAQINRLTSEVSEQTSLLAQLDAAVDALPDAGEGGGGSSLETCEVTIIHQWSGNEDPVNGRITFYYLTVSEDGELNFETAFLSSDSDYLPEHRVTFTTLKDSIISIKGTNFWNSACYCSMVGGIFSVYMNGDSGGDTDALGVVLGVGIAIPTEDTATITVGN